MEIRHLRLIKFIVEEGSLTKAMDKLHLTQSALSHQLKEAEYQLGTKIFLRINKKMILTKAGEKVYALANDVIGKMDEAHHEIKKLIYGESGEIKISTECYTSYHWLPSLMRQFHLLYPNVELKIVVEATHYPIQGLLNGALDVAITSDPVKNDHVEYTELFQDEMVAVVPDSHAWAKRKFITAEDFTGENLIVHSLPMETVTIHTALLEPAGITPKKVTVVPLTEASIEMVKAEMGVIVMAQWALKPYLHNGALKTVKIGKNGLKRRHYVATLHDRPHAGYFDQFIEFLQREIML